MPMPQIALLPERGILHISGDDAPSFLQGLVTNDIDNLEDGSAMFCALLTPQGKVLFDFFIVKMAEGYLIDAPENKTAELAKRLSFYKLRAKVDIVDFSEEKIVGAVWGGTATLDDVIIYDDPRLDDLGQRFISDPQQFETNADEHDYKAHRIKLGIAQGGEDFEFGAIFAHEANMDLLHGIDFDKGCYVGQEVVSRMHHRGTTRKRFVPVIGKDLDARDTLPELGTQVRAGPALIGTMGSSQGPRGLALIRLDRAGEAAKKGLPLTAQDVRLNLIQPNWATFNVPTESK